jgi:hypothetical protein
LRTGPQTRSFGDAAEAIPRSDRLRAAPDTAEDVSVKLEQRWMPPMRHEPSY